MTLSRTAARLILPFLEKVAKGSYRGGSIHEEADRLLQILKPKKRSGLRPARVRRLEKAAKHAAETAAIRKEVFKRADGICETPTQNPYGGLGERCVNVAVDLDHWLGGNGRRRQMQSVETTWALCRLHHGLRGDNYPSAANWNLRFAWHCRRHGYDFTPHIEHQRHGRP